MNEQISPVIPEEVWADSMLSIARYYGGIKIKNEHYIVVNKEGISVYDLSNPKSKHYVGDGESKCIKPGEPCDLVNIKWVQVYKKLGRDKLFKLIKQGKSLEECKGLAKEVKE